MPVRTTTIITNKQTYTNKQNFTGTQEGGKDTCQGDSGGPIVIVNDNNEHILAGITSWGDGCGEPGVPAVYARVSVAMPWIKTVVCNCWGVTEASFCSNLVGTSEIRQEDYCQYIWKPNPTCKDIVGYISKYHLSIHQ